MIEIEIIGLNNCGPPEQEKWTPRRIRKLLVKLPVGITERCSIIVCKSTRSPVNDSGRATPLIRILSGYSDPGLVPVADALSELEGDFDIQIVDSAKVSELKEFLKTFSTLKEQL